MLGLDRSCNRRAIWNGAEETVLQKHHVLVVMVILKPQYLLITHSKQSVNICQMKREICLEHLKCVRCGCWRPWLFPFSQSHLEPLDQTSL